MGMGMEKWYLEDGDGDGWQASMLDTVGWGGGRLHELLSKMDLDLDDDNNQVVAAETVYDVG
jgi:hypothetical protein